MYKVLCHKKGIIILKKTQHRTKDAVRSLEPKLQGKTERNGLTIVAIKRALPNEKQSYGRQWKTVQM